MTENVIKLVPKAAVTAVSKPEPVESIIKILKSLLARAEVGELRAISFTGVDLVKNPEDYVCKYSMFVSYDYDLGDAYTLEHFLISGHDIAVRRIMDNCILPDLELTDAPGSDDPES